MRSKLGFVWAFMASMAIGQSVEAQGYGPMPGGVYNQGGIPADVYGQGGYDQGNGFQPMMGDFQVGMPGRLWIETNIADRGLGYRGSYLTLGGKTRLWEDMLDGRWLLEAQAHYALESEGFFGNLGIERVFSIKAAQADFVVGGWLDYDGDKEADFSHSFYQMGVNAAIKSRRWDLVGNGYFPIATTAYTMGDPTGANCFFGNNILETAAIDNALRGFDVTFRARPAALGMVNGTIDIGGYGYQSNEDLIDPFFGGRVRFGVQVLRGLIVNAEVNHDDRFNTTGVLQLAYQFGVNARGTEYSSLGRDLEPTIRNDHIVRFRQDLKFLLDPDTGLPYHVIHVDNTADPAFANGQVDTPYRELATAEANSKAEDIIFVNAGDGTTNFYNEGIALKDGQMLLGNGVEHLIPTVDGRFFRLCNSIDGNRPRITDNALGPAVELANRNTVRGFNITGADGNMAYGIRGDGDLLGSPIDSGIIEDNIISGAILHGVFTNNTVGDWTFARNAISENGFDGIRIVDACDPDSIYLFEENNVSSNGRHGIVMQDYTAAEITFLSNVTNSNGGDGVRLENFKGPQRADITFASHRANGNVGNGIHVNGGDGDLRFLNSLITNNLGSGIRIVDWTNSDARDVTLVGTSTGGNSILSGNLFGVDNELNGGTQRLIVTDSTLNGNTGGLRSTASGFGTVLTTEVVENRSISNNLTDGAVFAVADGALHNVLVESAAGGGLLQVNGNGTNGSGAGLRFRVGDELGQIATMLADVRNVNVSNTQGNGVVAQVFGSGFLDFDMTESTIQQSIATNGTSSGNGFVGLVDNRVQVGVNRIRIEDVSFLNNAADSVQIQTGDDTLTDIILRSNLMTHNLAQVTDTSLGRTFFVGGANGISVTSFGATPAVGPGVGVIDNRTRLLIEGNVISNHQLNGIQVASAGDSSMLMLANANQIRTNGSGGNVDAVPFFNGISLFAIDESLFSSRITNNNVTQNFEAGIRTQTAGTARFNSIMVDNNFGGNDIGIDPLNEVAPGVPIRDSLLEAAGVRGLIADIRFINGLDGNSCIAMSNNVVAILPEVTNLNAPNQFRLELDGLSNGFNYPDLFLTDNGVTQGAFGSVCEGLVAAEEAAFAGDGFPTL